MADVIPELEVPMGRVPEWPKGTGCKPVGLRLRWFESNRAQSRTFGRNERRGLHDDLGLKHKSCIAGPAGAIGLGM